MRRHLPLTALVLAALLIALGVISGLGPVRPRGPAASEESLRDALVAEQKVFITEQAFADSVSDPADLEPDAAVSWVRAGAIVTSHPEGSVLAVVPGAASDPTAATNPNAVVLTTEGSDGRCYSVAEINLAQPGTGPAGTYYRDAAAGAGGCASPALPTDGPGLSRATSRADSGTWEAAW